MSPTSSSSLSAAEALASSRLLPFKDDFGALKSDSSSDESDDTIARETVFESDLDVFESDLDDLDVLELDFLEDEPVVEPDFDDDLCVISMPSPLIRSPAWNEPETKPVRRTT